MERAAFFFEAPSFFLASFDSSSLTLQDPTNSLSLEFI
jgi:hypothetical protein